MLRKCASHFGYRSSVVAPHSDPSDASDCSDPADQGPTAFTAAMNTHVVSEVECRSRSEQLRVHVCERPTELRVHDCRTPMNMWRNCACVMVEQQKTSGTLVRAWLSKTTREGTHVCVYEFAHSNSDVTYQRSPACRRQPMMRHNRACVFARCHRQCKPNLRAWLSDTRQYVALLRVRACRGPPTR